MVSVAEKDPLNHFHETRKNFAALMNVLLHKRLASYSYGDDLHSVILGDELARSIMINGLPSGVQISLPAELKAILDCEFDCLQVTRDAVRLGMRSLYRIQGDNRILYVVIPITHAMAQHLRECQTVDVGTYRKECNEYIIRLDQYFHPEYMDISLFSSKGSPCNWIQLTALGGECISLEAQCINVSSDYDANMSLLKSVPDDTGGDLDEFYKVTLSIRQG